MAKPIESTPVLKGDDLKNFVASLKRPQSPENKSALEEVSKFFMKAVKQ